MSRRGRIASDQLTHRLVDLAPGRRPRCGDGETSRYWTSEDPKERALAAIWCTGCEAFAECDAAATANRDCSTGQRWPGLLTVTTRAQLQPARTQHRSHPRNPIPLARNVAHPDRAHH